MATIYDRQLLAKIEITKGTDPVPVAANAVRCKSFKVTPSSGTIERKVVKQTMGGLPHLIGKETNQIEIVLELRGSGAAGTAPESSPLLQSCRMAETISAGVSVTYKPASATEKSCTIYAYQDGLLWKLIGAVGDAKISSVIDDVITVTLTMSAAYVAPTATGTVATPVYDSTQPLVMSSATVINDGAAIKVGKFDIELGNDVQNHYTTGQNVFVVADRNPSVSLTKDSISTAAEWTALSAGTNLALTATYGSTAGNICTISAPVARRKSVSYEERGERDLLKLSYGLYESTSDDQLSIVLT